jgi:integrase
MVKFTDAWVKSQKADGKQHEYRDEVYPLFLVVQATGSKSWVYRWKQAGKSHRHTFGYYPEMPLTAARDAALKYKSDLKTKKLAPVVAPVVPIVVEDVVDDRMTVSEAYALYMASPSVLKLSDGTIAAKERALEKDIEPVLGTRPVASLTYEDIEDIIEAKYERILDRGGNGVGANRLHANFSGFLRWCRTTGRKKTGVKSNPMADMPKIASETPLSRYFSEKELGWFFQALPVANGHARAYELLLRTICRRAEILDLRWDQLEGDRLIFGTSKNGRAHIVSLTPSAKGLIGVRPDDAKDRDRVFDNHPTANTRSMARLVAKMSELAKKDGSNAGVEHWTLHTFRRTATTIMGGFHGPDDRQLIDPDTRSRLLNHIDASVRGKVYDKYDNFAEKRAAITLWGNFLDNIKSEALK